MMRRHLLRRGGVHHHPDVGRCLPKRRHRSLQSRPLAFSPEAAERVPRFDAGSVAERPPGVGDADQAGAPGAALG